MKPKYWNKGKIYLSNKDKVLKNLIKNFPKEHMILNSNYYHALLNSIIGQQISVSAANAVKNRFFKLDKNMTPKKLLKIDIRALKKIGLSRQKIQYIKNISIFFIENKKFINKIDQYDESVIRSKLIDIKADNLHIHNIVLKSSKPNVKPLILKIGNSLLSDTINCFDQLNESSKVRIIKTGYL